MEDFEKELNIVKEKIEADHFVCGKAEDMMKDFDKRKIQQKLRELNMGFLADKIEPMSEEALKNLILSNPQILKKANEILNSRR